MCFNTLHGTENESLPCGHTFHVACIAEFSLHSGVHRLDVPCFECMCVPSNEEVRALMSREVNPPREVDGDDVEVVGGVDVANTNNAAECCQKLKRERPTSLEANVKKPKGSEFDEAPPQEAPARIVMPKASPMPPDRDYHRAVAKAVAVPKTHAKKRAGTRRNWEENWEECLRSVSWHGAEARRDFILTWPRPTSKEEDEEFFSRFQDSVGRHAAE